MPNKDQPIPKTPKYSIWNTNTNQTETSAESKNITNDDPLRPVEEVEGKLK